MEKPTLNPEIPDKLYFRVGEVSALLGVEPYVLRFWETEFPALVPKRSGSGHRLYRRKDVELLLKIKHLLYEKRFTIQGAKQFLQAEMVRTGRKSRKRTEQRELFTGEMLAGIRKNLREILDLLK